MSAAALPLSDAVVLSTRLRQGLADRSLHRLKPLEERMVHLMCLDSYDRAQERGKLALVTWAQKLGLVDAKGVRTDKCADIVRALYEMLVVDVNWDEKTFELRPDVTDWSKVRSLRAGEPPVYPELKLSAERELSEALSESSREKALATGQVAGEQLLPGLFSKLRAALAQGDVQSAVAQFLKENFPGLPESNVRRINPPTGISADKSADKLAVPLAGLVPVPKAELAVPAVQPATASSALVQAKRGPARKASADLSAEAFRWLASIDLKGKLKEPAVIEQWMEICERYPNHVLNRLRGAYEDVERRVKSKEPGVDAIVNPLAWLSRKARDEGKLRPLGRGK